MTREPPESGSWPSALDTTARRMPSPAGAASSRAHVVYNGNSISSTPAPAVSASSAASAQILAVRLASQVLPEPGPPSTTSRAHRLARSSASSSSSPQPSAIRSFRSMTAGVSRGPPNRMSRGQGSVLSHLISVAR